MPGRVATSILESVVSRMLSIVIPAFDEADNLEALLARVSAEMAKVDLDWEVVLVDDGSTDGTFERAVSLQEVHPQLHVLRLTRNFGHQAALLAGLRAVRGDGIVTMDADLQHPPELLPTLVERWKAGFPVVQAVRTDSGASGGLAKRVSSQLYYRLLRRQTGLPLKPGMADFRLVDRRVLDHVLDMNESLLFLRGAFAWVGYPQTEVSYQPGRRPHGGSRYSLRKMMNLARGGIVSFSAFPLYVSFFVGVFIAGVSATYGIYAVAMKVLTDETVPGWTSLAALVAFLFGIHFIMMGLIGVYLGAAYHEIKRRPPYIVERSVEAKQPLAREPLGGPRST